MGLEGYKSMHLFFAKNYGVVSGLAYRAIVFVLIGLRVPVHWVKGSLGVRGRSPVSHLAEIALWATGCKR